MMLVISGIVFYKNHSRYRKLSCDGIVELTDDFAPRSFTYSELEKVTDGFREEVGRGSFGAVYKGTILNGQKVVAIKRLEKVLAEGEREFQTEMKSVDWNLPEEEAILEEWAYHCFEAGDLAKLVGDEEFDKKQVERMVKLGIWCIQDEPSLRPSMKKVLLMLEGTVDIPIPPSPDCFLSMI
ncbi:hypothetical protein FH972_002843 [Carpinus fangiana]|uniref:Protein kinase domain-containing protein n=1 Tax=Carpinus fangiana TaxID=176857 RepID=A0A5N6QIR8_9ROSI|nr:hypothetical protein FH972_002843 [Carpinus fangiana]